MLTGRFFAESTNTVKSPVFNEVNRRVCVSMTAISKSLRTALNAIQDMRRWTLPVFAFSRVIH